MDAMTLLGGLTPTANVAQVTGNTNNSNNASANGGAFQKQLFSIIGSHNAEAAETESAKNVSISDNAELLQSNSSELINEEGSALVQLIDSSEAIKQLILSEEFTAESLNEFIELLLDQLDQLTNVDLTDDQQNLIYSLLQQVNALTELLNNSTQEIKGLQTFASALTVGNASSSNSPSDAIIKLADQLLLLQQSLQNNTNKVIAGQQAGALVQEQLLQVQAKLNELLADVKLKGNQFAEVNQVSAELLTHSNANAASHLERMTQENSFNPVAQKIAAEAADGAKPQNAQVSQAPTTQSLSQAQNINVEQPQVQTVLPEYQLRSDNAKEFLLQLARGTSNTPSAYVIADEFAETMKELIVHRFNVSTLNGVTEAKLSLSPEHLGNVDVKISVQNGLLTAVFQTETAMAKDALENQILMLRASLAQQGITVEKIEVEHTQLASGLNQGNKQQSNGNHQEQEQSGSRNKEESFEEELLINVAQQQLGFGRAVNEII